MATLTGTKIANTYKQLLQVGSSNTGLTGTVQAVQDGGGNASPLELSQNAVNINGTFQLSGVTLTANASTLNAVADLTGATGIVAVSGGSVYGRTITGGAGVSISNADGTEGNPTIALNTTGVVSASYGPATNIEVNAVGQIVSAGAATSVSVSGVTANTFTGGTFAGTTGDFSSNVSVGGNLVIAGQFSPASLSVTGTINANKISATDATFNNIVSAGFFVGDGSGLINVPSAEGGTVKAITAGTGIKLTVDAAVTTTMPVSGTVAVSANQNFGTVSVSTALAVTGSALFGIVSATNIDTDELLIAGVSAATVNEVAAVSALTQTNLDSITSINIVVANVSAVTSVNAAAITSINTIIGDGSNFATSAELAATSLALATSIATANTRITSVSDYAVALSATLATSIGNSNTNIATVSALTSVNLAAITSINVVVANVSALTSVNAAAITSINAVIEGNVSADSGTFNTLTVITSASIGGTLNVGGNVGIGATPSGGKLYVNQGADGQSAGFRITHGSGDARMYINANIPTLDAVAGGGWNFSIAGTERMRIDSSGNLRLGTTTGNADAKMTIYGGSTDSSPSLELFKGSTTNTTSQVFMRFEIARDTTPVASGSITANGAAAATFTAWSDRKLKENIVDLSPQLENICKLKPSEFDFIGYPEGEGHQIGFIAQDMQEVYPDVVSEGKNGMLQISGWSKTEARLVKALQEAVQKIEALEARITSLETN